MGMAKMQNTSVKFSTTFSGTRQQTFSKKLRTTALLMTAAIGLSGCAGPVVGALSLVELASMAGIASTFMTGKDLPEHALSMATGKDCRVLESILNAERELCEEEGSRATNKDFQGVLALMESDPALLATALADVETQRMIDPSIHGFTPVDRSRLASSFRVDAAPTKARASKRKTAPLSFGFLQSSYGQNWSYEMTAERKGTQATATVAVVNEEQPIAVMAYAGPTPLPAFRSDGKMISPDAR